MEDSKKTFDKTKKASKYGPNKSTDKYDKDTRKKKKEKRDLRSKIQEKKDLRQKQKREKKLVDDIVEIVKDIFPVFTTNEYFRKYFNVHQFIKIEMFPEFQQAKEEYDGDNNSFRPTITSLIEKVYIISNAVSTAKFVAEIYYDNEEKFNNMMLLYIKDSL